jgi:alanyl-tRNA synthetase
LRRLIRRAVRYSDLLSILPGKLAELVAVIARKYKGVYDNVAAMNDIIVKEISEEEEKFRKTLERGTKEFSDLLAKGAVSGHDAFILFSTYGFPFELTLEMAKEKGLQVNKEEFAAEMKKHQELSRAGSQAKFKGGLANTNETTVMYHTVTHLMLAGLQKYLGPGVHQAGSNITEERLRFDFTYPTKVDKAILEKVEAYVNDAIGEQCEVKTEVMDKNEAMSSGVEGSFWEKYPDRVTVYTVTGKDGTVYSRELCGGPHVTNTEKIQGRFKIVKEEAVSAGVRRIKAAKGARIARSLRSRRSLRSPLT